MLIGLEKEWAYPRSTGPFLLRWVSLAESLIGTLPLVRRIFQLSFRLKPHPCSATGIGAGTSKMVKISFLFLICSMYAVFGSCL